MALYNDITKPAPPLPSAELVPCRPGVSLLPPLTRRGFGPGLVILVPTHNDQTTVSINAERVPSLCVKWVEEGYAVVEIQHSAMASGISSALQSAIEALSRCDKCEPKDKIGVVGRLSVHSSVPLHPWSSHCQSLCSWPAHMD